MFYYVLAPALMALWPLLVWGVYLPRAQQAEQEDLQQRQHARELMLDILKYDPGRLDAAGPAQNSGRFIPNEAISRVADRCNIASRNYTPTIGPVVPSSGKKIQGIKVALSDIGIVQACRFLSTIQSMWVNLECENLKLTKKEGLPDQWNVEMSLKYTY